MSDENQNVKITEIDVSFRNLLNFFFKAMVAFIPALIGLILVAGTVMSVLAGVFSGMMQNAM